MDSVNVFTTFNNFTKNYEHIWLFLNTLLWFVCVFYTIKSFIQIKKQTDLASEAYLVVNAESKRNPENVNERLSVDFKKLHDKWIGIIKANMPEAIQTDEFFLLKFSNRGKSDIQKWVIDININVQPGDPLFEKKNIGGDNLCFKVESCGFPDYINVSNSIDVIIGKINNFPIININWQITYVDIKGTNYVKFGGDSSKEFRNILAFPNV